MPDLSVRCGCGRTMTLDTLRGRGAYRCGCGARVQVAVPDVKRCAGYENGHRCRLAVAPGLPVDLCPGHAQELREAWRLDFAARQREANVDRYGTERLARFHEGVEREGLSRADVKLALGIAAQPGPDPHPPIVYYLRFGDRIKIGTTTNLPMRLTAIPHDELLATEPGDRTLEQRRHRQFQHRRITGEWFESADDLLAHIEQVKREARGDR